MILMDPILTISLITNLTRQLMSHHGTQLVTINLVRPYIPMEQIHTQMCILLVEVCIANTLVNLTPMMLIAMFQTR